MTRLHWVRHGPTHAKTMVGWTDLPADLSDHDRIARLSAHLPRQARLISSDLSRAATTADALSSAERQRLPHDPALRELHFGAWENRRFAEIEIREPEAIAAFWQKPGTSPATGGESWNDMAARVSSAADRLAEVGGDIVVVAHFGAILSQLQRARRSSTLDILAQRIDNLSVTRLVWQDGLWVEELANHCP